MESKQYVFLSYSRQDREIAEKLSAMLQQRGVAVWRDLEQILPGSAWEQEIEKGMVGADALIYLASKNSVHSEWMNIELQAFLNHGKLIIPIVADDSAAQAMPAFLSHYQWLDLRHGVDRAIERIVEALKGTVTIGAPVEEPQNQSKGYVFISYAEEDTDFVEELKTFMKERGYAYWDYQESDRDYHSQLFLELESVIQESVATCSVLSEAWKRSSWAVKEYFFSEEVGIPVFLLRAKKISPTLAIAGIPYIDFIPSKQAGFEKLERELKRKKL